MTQRVGVINLSRKPIRLGTTHVPPAKDNPAATLVDLDVGAVRRDLARYNDRVAIVVDQMSADGGLQDAPLGTATITPGAEAADEINVAIQLKNTDGSNVASIKAVDAWFGTSATDPTLASAAPDGGAAAGANGKLVELVADKAFKLVTNATGAVNVVITESTAKSFFLWVALPNGKTQVQTVTFA